MLYFFLNDDIGLRAKMAINNQNDERSEWVKTQNDLIGLNAVETRNQRIKVIVYPTTIFHI